MACFFKLKKELMFEIYSYRVKIFLGKISKHSKFKWVKYKYYKMSVNVLKLILVGIN